MDEEVKAPKRSLKKTAPVTDPVPQEVPVYTGYRRNVEMEEAFAKMAAYVAENENAEDLDIEFYVDEKAKVVVARVEYLHDITEEIPPKEVLCMLCMENVKYGLARCAEGDRWNPLLGKYLALKRAKGTKIPAKILAAIGHVMY